MTNLRLSKNFTLDEFTRSQTAARMGRQIIATPLVTRNLINLCESVLQPIRDRVGPIQISSGYRPDWLNKKIGGARNSAHLTGRAADFHAKELSVQDLFYTIARSDIPYDKVIIEFGRWVHIQVPEINKIPRRMSFSAQFENGRTIYKPVNYA